jgi:hypothetical protein
VWTNSPEFIAQNVLGTDRRTNASQPPVQALQENRAATLLRRQDITRVATDSLYVSGTGDTGRSSPAAEDGGTQKQRQRLLAFAHQTSLGMDGDRITEWMEANKLEPGKEHRVAIDAVSNRVVKTVAVNAVKTVGDDGQMAPSTPYDYLTDHLFSNLLYDV